MTTTNTDAKMTLDEAKVYLQDKSEFMKFDEALAIVKAAGETEFLKSLNLSTEEEIKNGKTARALTYYAAAIDAREDYMGLYAVGHYLDSEKILYEADEIYRECAEKDDKIKISDEDAIVMNIRRMNHDIKDYDLGTLEQDPETKRLMDSANVVDEENDFAPVSEAERKRLFEGLLESAKNQTIIDNAGKDDLFKLAEDQRRREIRDSIKNTFQNKMLVAIGASNDMHLTKETQKKSFSFVQYAKGVINYLTKAVSSGKKVDLHKGQMINSMVDTQLRMEERAKLYRQLGMVNAANAIEKQKTGFVSKMKGWFGKAYEQRHAIADNMKNNKYKYIAMGLAGVTVAVSTPLVAATTAAYIGASYAGFIGAGSVIWPLVEKREAMLRQAKKDKNEALIATIKKQGLVASLKGAYNLMDAEEKKRYWQRAGVNTAAGVAGAAFIAAPALIGAKGALTSVALVSNKFVASTMRIFGNLGIQYKFKREDEKQAEKDQTEESRQKAKMSKISFYTTAAFAAVAEIAGLAHSYLSGDETPTTSGGKAQGALEQQHGKGGKGAEILEQKPAAKAPTAEELAAQKAAEEAAAKAAEVQKFWEDYQVPTSFEDVTDSDVSKSDWNFIQRNLVGVYATTQGAEHFGTTAADSQATFDEALRNVATYMHEHPEAGEGKSPLKVLSEVLRRHALSVQAHPDGDGHWVAKFDGAWHYGDKSLDQNMNAWMAIICNGYKADVPEGTDLNAPLANLQHDLIEATRNGNGNRVIGIKCDQTAFARGRSGGAVKIEQPAPKPEPKQVKLNDELKNEDIPHQVNLNEEVENQDVKRGAVWEEERGTTIDGKNQHPNMLRSGNHVKSQGIEI